MPRRNHQTESLLRMAFGSPKSLKARSKTPGDLGAIDARIDVPAPDGVLDCYLHTPGGTGRW